MFAIKRPIAVFMFALALAIFGYRSLRQINTSFLPEIAYPEFIVVGEYPYSSSKEVERFITRPLEESLASLPALQELRSHSRDGHAVLTLQFNWDIDVRYTLLRIRDKIDAVYDQFPAGAERPFIMDFNPGSLPILEFTLSGNTDLTSLTAFARDVIRPRFSQIEGVAGALISGMPTDAVQIIMKKSQCDLYGISPAEIEQAVQRNLPDRSFSQRVKLGYAEHALTVEFPIHQIGDMLEMPITNRSGVPITLGKVADIRRVQLPFHAGVYTDTTAALCVSLYKEAGANAIAAARQSVTELNRLSAKHPEFHFQIIKNQGEFVAQAISSLQQSIGLGALLAFFVILLFLKNLRFSLILALVIPVSLLLTCNALFLHNITFNIMTLGGLALGIGLIVDNGIVMLDSIEKSYRTDDKDRSIHAGVRRVRRAIAGSTFTTIAIFFPIIYVKGYAAILFKEQALAITYILLISLLAAITLIPSFFKFMVARSTGKKNHQEYSAGKANYWSGLIRLLIQGPARLITMIGRGLSILLRPISRLFDRGYHRSESVYHRLLAYFLRHKAQLGVIVLILLIIVLFGYRFFLTAQYWPEVASDRVEIRLEVPAEIPYALIRTDIKKTIRGFLELPRVKEVITRSYDPQTIDRSSVQTVNMSPGYYTIHFTICLKRTITNRHFNRHRFRSVIALPFERITIERPTPLQKEVVGKQSHNLMVYLHAEDIGLRDQLTEKLAGFLSGNTATADITIDRGGIKQVVMATLNRSAYQKYALDSRTAAQGLKTMTSGIRVGWWQTGYHKLPIVLQSDSVGSKSLVKVMQSRYNSGLGLLRNEQLFTTRLQSKKLEHKRVDRKPVIAVSAQVGTRQLQGVIRAVNRWIQQHQHPKVDIFLSDESQKMARSFRDLLEAFLMAAIIVYLILAAQFESFRHPLNIILTVPIGIMGALLGLILFGISLNVISLIGMVMLVGIGVNDAIIKLDYMVLLRQQGQTVRKAVLQASRDKYRPVMMTTLTTIAAMLPMALGLGGNSEINQPLAVTIIGGLTFTTILTLFVTPVVFELMAKKRKQNG